MSLLDSPPRQEEARRQRQSQYDANDARRGQGGQRQQQQGGGGNREVARPRGARWARGCTSVHAQDAEQGCHIMIEI